jgi:hypothetical protein
MAAALIDMTSDKVDSIEFSMQLGEGAYALLVNRPDTTHKSDALLAPFTDKVIGTLVHISVRVLRCILLHVLIRI